MIIKKDAEHARLEWVRGWGLVIHFVRESFGRLVLFEKIAWVSRARALLPRKDKACGVPPEPVRERCVVGRQSGSRVPRSIPVIASPRSCDHRERVCAS